MIAYIICEGAFDVALLRQILPQDLLINVEIVAAGGLSAIKSLSRSLLVRRQVPIAIVADSDSIIPESVQERRRSIEELISSVAVDTYFKVILAVPSIETVFFQDSKLLPRLLGFEPSQEILSLATAQPYKALKELLGQAGGEHGKFSLFHHLTDEDLKALCRAQVMQEIIHFLEAVQGIAKAS